MLDKVKTLANRLAYGAAPTDAPPALDAIPLTTLEGAPFDAAELKGKVVLFVNVASRCGLTPQYDGLVKLFHRFRDEGFLIVGVPCNQFLGQEPGSAEAIASFCSLTYGVDFPLLEKQDVNGAQRSPLYRWLIAGTPGEAGDISWNFEKFLVGRDGQVAARFSPRTVPEATEIVTAIEAALKA